MPDRYLKVVEAADNVATVLRDLEKDEEVEVQVGNEVRPISVQEDVPFGHKIAVADIDEEETVYKYGTSIGNATEAIVPGQWVHVHNVESNYGRGDLATDESEVDAVN